MFKPLRIFLMILVGVLVLFGTLDLFPGKGKNALDRDESALAALSSLWVSAIADRNPRFVDLLSKGSVNYYEQLREVALHGDISEINALGPIDQLQVMFLRLSVDGKELQGMSGEEILVRAVSQDWIGVDLRRTDELREVVVAGDGATGRLYKFGRDDRPDRGRQYFVRDSGEWRVDIRGERERLQMGFEAFVSRSGLSPSEAAFFILETRLLRKVTPADFIAPSQNGTILTSRRADPTEENPVPHLRLIAIRESPDDPLLTAVTIEDREASLRTVLSVGDAFGSDYGFQLVRTDGERAWLARNGATVVFQLEPEGPPLDQRLRTSESSHEGVSMLDQARVGEHRDGLMSQWRNVGLRGRPQLLQQVWLVPEFSSDRGSMLGLRVRNLIPGSFWHQLGLAAGDLLEQVNDEPIDSMNRWQELMRVAQHGYEISVTLQRNGRKLKFDTKTVPPRGTAEPT